MGSSGQHEAVALPRFSFSLAVLAVAVLLSHPSEARTVSIATLCSHTDYPTVCLATAKGLKGFEAGAEAGAKAIAQMTIQAAIRKTHQATALAAKLRASRRKDNIARNNLQTCQQSYDSALSDLQTSMKALRSSSLADLKINLSSVITNVGTCDDGFTENPGMTSPLADVNTIIHKFASNGLALSDMLKNRH